MHRYKYHRLKCFKVRQSAKKNVYFTVDNCTVKWKDYYKLFFILVLYDNQFKLHSIRRYFNLKILIPYHDKF